MYWIHGFLRLDVGYDQRLGPKLLSVGVRPKVADLVKVGLEASSSVQQGETIPLTVTIENISGEPLTL